MEIKLDSGSSNVTVVKGDQRYPLRRPKIKEARSLEDNLKRAEKKEVSHYDVMGSFLEALGLPKAIFEELDTAECEAIVKALTTSDSKKN